MFHFRAAIFAAIAFTGPLPAAPTVKLPESIQAAPGRLVNLVAESTGTTVRWALAGEGADLIPFPGCDSGKHRAIFSSPTPGRYIVLAWTAAGDVPSEAARCVIVVGDPPPVPPGPGPGPGPRPTPPNPADPLSQELSTLYRADPHPLKASYLPLLTELYRQAADLAKDSTVSSTADLVGRLRTASASLLPGDVLGTMRDRVAIEVAKELGEETAPMTDALRSKASALFARIHTCLQGIK